MQLADGLCQGGREGLKDGNAQFLAQVMGRRALPFPGRERGLKGEDEREVDAHSLQVYSVWHRQSDGVIVSSLESAYMAKMLIFAVHLGILRKHRARMLSTSK